MKRILLAGYGNIAHAFEKILLEQETVDSYQLTVCDIADGNDIMDYLPHHHDEFDVVLNTSLANSIALSKMCIDYGLDYIDVGIEDGIGNPDSTPSDYTALMKEMIQWKTHSRIIPTITLEGHGKFLCLDLTAYFNRKRVAGYNRVVSDGTIIVDTSYDTASTVAY